MSPSKSLPLPRSPLVRPLVADLAESITAGRLRPGARLPAVRELQGKYGVSIGTVQAALTHLGNNGLIERVRGSGTYVKGPASAKSEGSRRTVSPWVCFFVQQDEHHDATYGRFVDALLLNLQQAEILAVSAAWGNQAGANQLQHMIAQMHQSPPLAVILPHVDAARDEFIRRSCPKGVRIITSFRHPYFDYPGWHSVNPDIYGAFYHATEKLVAEGHRRIGVILKPRRISDDRPFTLRKRRMWHAEQIRGAGDVIKRAGLSDTLTFYYAKPLNISNHSDIMDLSKWLSSPNRPTAVIGEDTRVASVLHAAAMSKINVPGELKIIGIGDSKAIDVETFPRISLDYAGVAREVAKLVLAHDEDIAGATRNIVVPFQP